MAVNTDGSAWRQRVQATLAAKGTAITRGERLVTTLNALGPDIGIGSEAAMTWAFAIVTGLAVCFAGLRRLGRVAICWLVRLAIATLTIVISS